MGAPAKAWLKSDLIFPALLLGLSTMLFWKLLFAGEVLYWGTPLLQFFPWRSFAVASYLAGEIPLWNPYLGNGSPFAANWQSAVFYPLNAIYLLFPVERAMGYSVALHTGLAGVFMYFFGRTLGLSGFGSFVAGLGYAFGGFMVARAGFLSMTSTAPWLPLILAITERLLVDGGKRRSFQRKDGRGEKGKRGKLVLAGSLAIGLQLLAGHGQLAFYSLLLVLFYALYRAWQTGARPGAAVSPSGSEPPLPAKGSPPQAEEQDVEASAGLGGSRNRLVRSRPVLAWIISLLPVLAMLILGLGIAAVQLLPAAELALHSVRASGVDYDFAMAYSLYPWQLVGLLAPDFFGNPATGDYWGPGSYWEASGYIGVFPLVAGAIGLVVPVKRSGLPGRFFAGVVVMALLLALGNYLPVYPFVFSHVPGFALFQAPARFLFWYTLAAAILAGLGCDALLAAAGSARLERLGRVVCIAGASLAVATAALTLLPVQNEGVRPTFTSALLKPGILLAIAGLLVSVAGRFPRRWWQFCLGLFVAADLLLFGLPLNPTTEARVYGEGGLAVTGSQRGGEGLYRVYTPAAAFLGKFLATHSFRTFGSTDAAAVGRIRDTAIPDIPMAWGAQESYNYDPLQVGAAQDFLRAVDSSNLDPRLLGLMNVRYVLSDTVPPASQLRLALPGPNPVYENPEPLERAFFVDRAVKVSSIREALREVQKPGFEPLRTVVLSEPQPDGGIRVLDWLGRLYPVGPSGVTPEQVRPGVTLLEYAPQRVIVGTRVDRAGYVVLSDTFYPGWKAWVNGKPAGIYRANVAFRAIEVPPGQSLVEFRYEPASFKVGATVSVLGLALACLVWARRRRDAG